MKKRNSTQLKTLGTTLISVGTILASTNVLAASTPAHTVTHHKKHTHHYSKTVHESAQASEVKVCTKGGLFVKDLGNGNWFKIGGLIQADETIFMGSAGDKGLGAPASGPGQLSSGATLRRLRLEPSGGYGDNWSYKAILEFRPGGTINIKNAYINYAGVEPKFNLSFGQVTPATGLEYSVYVADGLFREISIGSNAFQAPDGLGIYADVKLGDTFAAQFAAIQPDANYANTNLGASASPFTYSTAYNDTSKADKWAGAARLLFSPVHDNENIFHFGVSAWYQALASVSAQSGAPLYYTLFTKTQEYKTRNNVDLIGIGLENPTLAGAINPALQLKSFMVGTVEAAGIMGPLLVQGQYYRASINQFNTALAKVKPSAWYAQVGYILTGEMRSYNAAKGVLVRPTPEAACGAWEVGLRYSYLGLNDKNVQGGSQHDTTFGLTWFASKAISFQAVYTRASIHPAPFINIASSKRKLDVFGLRFQAAF